MEEEATCQSISENWSRQVKQIVVRSRLALGLPSISRDVIDATAGEILKLLDDAINESNLEQVYMRAMKDKSTGYALSYLELNNAWRAMSVTKKAATSMPCPGCEFAKQNPNKPCKLHGTI